MSATRKAGVEFYPGVGVSPDLTGLAATLSAKYKQRGDASYTAVTGSFTEDNPGTYSIPTTITAVGDYQFIIESTDPAIENLEGNILVTAASIDDVKSAVDALQLDVTGIKATTDLLNTTELENLSEQITLVDTNLGNLTTLVDTVDANDGITSLRELLTDIQSGGVNVDSLINGQADIAAMLRGDEFLADGTTANPLHNNGLDEIHGKVDTLLVDVQTAITTAHDNIVTEMGLAKVSIETKIDAVQTVVDANKLTLEDAGYGLAALKDLLDALTTDVADSETNLTNILNDATNGLSAIKTAIMDKLTSMDAKLDTIGGSTRSRIYL